MATYQSEEISDDSLAMLCINWLGKKDELSEGSGILGLIVEAQLGIRERRIINNAINALPEEARSYPRFIHNDPVTVIPADLTLESLVALGKTLKGMGITYYSVPWHWDDQYLPDILGIRI